MNEIYPIFRLHGSVGKSILTSEDCIEIDPNSPTSIIAIAVKNGLDRITVIEDSFTLFPDLLKNCSKHNIELVFGLNFTICNDVKQKDDNSLLSNCKVSVIMKNSDGYKDLIRLHDAINANRESFYYTTRGDWNILRDNMSDNLRLIIPPYDNFIHKNMLEYGNCIPNLNELNPIFTYSQMELPIDEILSSEIKKYSLENKFEYKEVHPIYYYSYDDFESYMVFRAIHNRRTFLSPDIQMFCSNEFCFTSWINKIGK